MIKQLRSLLLLALLAVIGQANAQAVFTETFDGCASVGGNDGGWSGVSPTGKIVTDNEGWTFENGSAASQCAKFGTAKKLGSATTPAIALTGNGTLTFRAGAWKGDATDLALSAEGATLSVESVTMTNAAFGEYTVDITGATGSVTIKFAAAGASKNRFFLDDVVVTPTGASTKQSAGLEFSATSATAVLGQSFTAPTLSNPNNLTVAYSSSDESVATVAADGTVTPVAAGTTTIKATSEETDQFYAGSASYTLTVVGTVDNIAAFKALGAGKSAILNLSNAQVLYAYKNDMYVRDATGAIDFFKSDLDYTQNQVLNGSLVGTFASYNGTPELTNPSEVNITATEGTEATPVTLTVDQLTEEYYCDLVKFAGVYSADDNTLGGVALYDKFGTGILDDFTDGASYAVTGILVPFESEPELLVISYEESAKSDAGLSYGDVTSATAVLGQDFTEPTLQNPNNLPVTYTSSDENVATVDAEGNVTYTAVWFEEKEPEEFWVTYVDEDGTVYLEKTTVKKGDKEPDQPKVSKDGYIFGGWNRIVDKDGNVTYTAVWFKAENPDNPENPENPENPVVPQQSDKSAAPNGTNVTTITNPVTGKPMTVVRPESTGGAHTGDNNGTLLWIILAVASAGAGLTAIAIRRRRQREE